MVKHLYKMSDFSLVTTTEYTVRILSRISHAISYMIGPFSESRWQTIQYGLPMVTGRCSVRTYRRYCDLKIHRYSCLMVWYHIMMNTRHFFILFSSVCPLHFKGYYFPFVKRRCDFYHLKYMSVYWLRLKVNIGLLPDCTRLLRGVLYKRFCRLLYLKFCKIVTYISTCNLSPHHVSNQYAKCCVANDHM